MKINYVPNHDAKIAVKEKYKEILPEITADRVGLMRVFRNFVDNALKYGGDNLHEIKIGYQENKEIAKRHNSKVWLDTESKKGTTFHIAIQKELNAENDATQEDRGNERSL